MTVLGDLVIDGGIQTGPFGSQLHASDYATHGFGVVMPQDLGENIVVPNAMARVAPSTAESLNRHMLESGDIVFSRRGDVTRRALIRDDDGDLLCGTGCLRVRLDRKKADPVFVSYALAVKEARAWLVRHAVGATMANLNTGILSNLPLSVPGLSSQQDVGQVLGALDDKIAANCQAMRVSDALVRALYDRLPLSNVTLECVSVNVRESAEPADISPEEMYVGLENVERRSLWLAGRGVGANVTSSKSRFIADDVLFGKLRPYFHKVSLTFSPGVCSTDIMVIRARDPRGTALVAAAASSDALVRAAVQSSNGTKMPRANWADIASCSVPDPDSGDVREFCRIVDTVAERVARAIEENQRLVDTRDALLPLLMSGKITVKDAEKTVEEVV